MDYQEAYAKALRLLNTRFLSEWELRSKLKQREASAEVIDAVVETLRQEHFLDDRRLAAAVYEFYARKGQYGHRYILMRLKKRQLPVPEDVVRPDELETAERLVSRHFEEDADPRKIARFLQYRGFAPGIIRDIMDSRR